MLIAAHQASGCSQSLGKYKKHLLWLRCVLAYYRQQVYEEGKSPAVRSQITSMGWQLREWCVPVL